jgi:hypothetical protein
MKELLDQEAFRIDADPDALESTLRRRDRKRRNQRIAAGVVGIAVFVAAIWIVTSGLSLDRSETSVVPGGDVTGPAVTGPAETGPAETGPAETGPAETGPAETGPTGICQGQNFCIPPAGTPVSTPLEGELIAEAVFIRVYADGRVLSTVYENYYYLEQRLSPEGVERVRQIVGERVHLCCGAPDASRLENLLLGTSGDIGSPQSAWEDREGKPYVPARYRACFEPFGSPTDFEALLDLLPASAQALLRGKTPVNDQDQARGDAARCLNLTPEEARSLEEILSKARPPAWDFEWGNEVGAWSLLKGDQFISLRPLFPDGSRFDDHPF